MMNVRELIHALLELDPELPVSAEGCSQCSNGVKSVRLVPAYKILGETYDAYVDIEVDLYG